MKGYMLMIAFFSINSYAQHKTQFAVAGNLGQLPYQCYELNGLVSTPDRKYQFLLVLNKTYGALNENQKRNVHPFNKEFMKKEADRIDGYGFGGQLRMALKTDDLSPVTKFYVAAGLNYYSYKIRFFENEYVQDQSPFYHYVLAEHRDKLTRLVPDAQLVFNFSPNHLFLEFGLGVAYNMPGTSSSLEAYRNYHMNRFDYGYSGICPVISLRAGAWLF